MPNKSRLTDEEKAGIALVSVVGGGLAVLGINEWWRHRHPSPTSSPTTPSPTPTPTPTPTTPSPTPTPTTPTPSPTSPTPTPTPSTVTGMMVNCYGGPGVTALGNAQWSSIETALAQPGVENVPVLIVVLPGIAEQTGGDSTALPAAQIPLMIALQAKYPQVSYRLYLDTCGSSANPDGCVYVPLANAESFTATCAEWYNGYNGVKTYNPSGVRLVEGMYYDDIDWTTNQGGVAVDTYYSQLQAYAESIGLASNQGNTGGGTFPPGLAGTLPYWNQWENSTWPTPADLDYTAEGLTASEISIIVNGVTSVTDADVAAIAPYCNWIWACTPTDYDSGDYNGASLAPQLLAALAAL